MEFRLSPLIRLMGERENHFCWIVMAGEGCPEHVVRFEDDCLFMILNIWTDPREQQTGLLLEQHKQSGLHRYRFTKSGSGSRFEIVGPLERTIYVALGEDEKGQWGFRVDEQEERCGLAYRINWADEAYWLEFE